MNSRGHFAQGVSAASIVTRRNAYISRSEMATISFAIVLAAASLPTLADEPRLKIVCLGDSITDGNTYPLLVEAALREAKTPVPRFFNAGIGGDTADGMLARLNSDVLALEPDVVLISAGINDVHRKRTQDDYLRDISQILERLQSKKIRPVLLTTTAVRSNETQQTLDTWNTELRKFAKKLDIQVSDVAKAFADSKTQKAELLEPDGIHLSFAGYRVMAQAVLEGLGHPNVNVPEEIKWQVEPGVIRTWRVRRASKLLDGDSVKGVRVDETWKEYSLPEADAHEQWWFDQERQRGFGLRLSKYVGNASRFQLAANIRRDQSGVAFIRPGAYVHAVWVSGERVYQAPERYGWHLQPPIKVRLKAGDNQVLLETGESFFLSVLDEEP